MNRKLKALGLALVAVLAMAAFSAATASAEFHSEVEHTIIDGEQPAGTNDVFTIKAGTWTCENASYTGTIQGKTTSEVTVVPSYTGCTAFGYIGTTIDVPSGCDYRFTTTETQQFHIVCGATPITVTAFNCWTTIGSQTLTGITYTNGGSGTTTDVTVNANVTGLTYTQHSKSFPGCTNGTFSDGKWVGRFTVKATDTNQNHVGIWKT